MIRNSFDQSANIGWFITASAWLILLVISYSSYAPYLNHGDWTLAGVLANICGVNLSELGFTEALLMLASWLLMLAAMMGPVAFSNLSRDRKVSSIAMLGYATVWSAMGIALHSFGYVLQLVASKSDWFYFNGWSIGAATLLVIGLFQLSRLKSIPKPVCALCNSNLNLTHFKSGMRHGVECIQCCGLLMCLMFLFFPGNLLWMAVITVGIMLDRGMFGLRPLHFEIGVALVFSAFIVTVVQYI